MPAQPAAADGWDPAQYEKFAAERAQPFFDLMALVQPVPGGEVIDLGCGTGELTAQLHAHARAASTVGIDNSQAMLDKAAPHAGAGVRFEIGDLAKFDSENRFDVIFANAALHWAPHHPDLLARLARGLRTGGQLAVQVPANADHPAHMLAGEVARESPFRDAMDGAPPEDVVIENVLRPERYAELLDELGFAEQHVRLQVYGHRLASSEEVVEWTRGSSLTRFRRLMSPELFEAFIDRYRERVREVLGVRSPYFYSFKRILFWGRLP